MRLLREMIHNKVTQREGRTFHRRAARGIIMRGSQILLVYTKRYNDYSFPGGGIDDHEDLITGLKRELEEETGATRIEVLREFGYIDEYRPHHKPEYDLIHMLSYFYVCEVEADFKKVAMEDYEEANGMYPVWIDIHEAIRHNREVLAKQEATMGFSIERETWVLEQVAAERLS